MKWGQGVDTSGSTPHRRWKNTPVLLRAAQCSPYLQETNLQGQAGQKFNDKATSHSESRGSGVAVAQLSFSPNPQPAIQTLPAVFQKITS